MPGDGAGEGSSELSSLTRRGAECHFDALPKSFHVKLIAEVMLGEPVTAAS